jgi:hypothetical protein
MSWLTRRVQTARLRGKIRKKQVQGIRRRLRVPVEGNNTPRFLSGAINAKREQEAPVQPKNKQGGQQ